MLAEGFGPTHIEVRGAREHNLRGVDVRIPRDRLVVITGLSGSGKSSLAFDTLYAEGQRRYVESLSAYARQFLEQMEKPDVDSIEGLSPAISIEQKTTSSTLQPNSVSTTGVTPPAAVPWTGTVIQPASRSSCIQPISPLPGAFCSTSDTTTVKLSPPAMRARARSAAAQAPRRASGSSEP